MRSLIAGVDDAGRSCIVDEILIEDRDVHREGPSSRTDVFKLRETPPPPRPPAKASYHGLEPSCGHRATANLGLRRHLAVRHCAQRTLSHGRAEARYLIEHRRGTQIWPAVWRVLLRPPAWAPTSHHAWGARC